MTTPTPEDTHCKICHQPLPQVYYLCDKTMAAYCPECFDQTSCGRGQHGEGCPTQVFKDNLPQGSGNGV